MRKKIVAGNWKMNKSFSEAEDLLVDLIEKLDESGPLKSEVIICPPFLYLEMASDEAVENNFKVGAQNMSDKEYGAYTGEVSAPMLASMQVEYVILGHSERRTYFGETDEAIARKVDMAHQHGLIPIYCCGEVLAQRNAGSHFEVVKQQISEALFHLSPQDILKVIIAYEPVWAIGTGVTATPAQAQEMHAHIRNLLTEKYSASVAEEITILYGGSCNAQNAAELFANHDVDGGLIGGASLKAQDFVSIVNAF